jgi:large subunit ribosomal protein L31e
MVEDKEKNKVEKEIKEDVEKTVKEEIVETKPSKKGKVEETKEEKEYVIPLREKCRVVPRYKKTNKAVKTVKEFLVRHMKVYDRDLTKIKLDKYVNEFLWLRGIKRPPASIKVKAFKEGELVRVELAEEFPKGLAAKKRREEKIQAIADAGVSKKKKAVKAASEAAAKTKASADVPSEGAPAEGKKTEEEKKEEKEKTESGAEASKAMEKAAAKQVKHEVGGKTKAPKRPQRKSLAK